MKLSKLLLDSGRDIPFLEGTITIHQPTIGDIAIMGEEAFFNATQLLTFSKEKFLNREDSETIKQTTDFIVFVQLMNDSSTKELQVMRLQALMLLSLLFPDYIIEFSNTEIIFSVDGNKVGFINESNFDSFKELLVDLFCIKPLQGESYNPKGRLAEKIAKKLEEGRRKAAQFNKEKNGEINIFQKYISILSVGLAKDKKDLYNYTVYQLQDEFQRYQLKLAYDSHIQTLLAGAKMDKEPENWQKDLDENSRDS